MESDQAGTVVNVEFMLVTAGAEIHVLDRTAPNQSEGRRRGLVRNAPESLDGKFYLWDRRIENLIDAGGKCAPIAVNLGGEFLFH